MNGHNEYEQAFSEQGFWSKLKSTPAWLDGKSSKGAAAVLRLPGGKGPWAKATIAGALGYFIVPLDAIADITPPWATPTTWVYWHWPLPPWPPISTRMSGERQLPG